MTSLEVLSQSDSGMALARAAASVMNEIRGCYPALKTSDELEEIAADLDAIRAGTLVSPPPPETGGF